MDTAWKEEFSGTKMCMRHPSAGGVLGLIRDFELHWTLSLLLHDDGARGHTLAVADIIDSQLHQIAGP